MISALGYLAVPCMDVTDTWEELSQTYVKLMLISLS